jgi:nitrogen fixation-related uncharacterized protein
MDERTFVIALTILTVACAIAVFVWAYTRPI